MKKLLMFGLLVGALSLTGCSALNNQINKVSAGVTSSDYVVVKFGLDGKPSRYWIIRNNFVNNEESSDGYYWSDAHSGLDRVTNADAYDVKGLIDSEVIKKYHLENAMEIAN